MPTHHARHHRPRNAVPRHPSRHPRPVRSSFTRLDGMRHGPGVHQPAQKNQTHSHRERQPVLRTVPWQTRLPSIPARSESRPETSAPPQSTSADPPSRLSCRDFSAVGSPLIAPRESRSRISGAHPVHSPAGRTPPSVPRSLSVRSCRATRAKCPPTSPG